MDASEFFFKSSKNYDYSPTIRLVKDYVVAIDTKSCSDDDDKQVGNGVIIGDLLITAGHVVKDCKDAKFIFNANGTTLKLDSLEKLYECYIVNPGEYDLAIYRVPGINTPYVLSSKRPVNGQILRSESIDAYNMKPTICNAEVKGYKEDLGLYFRVDTDKSLVEGCSGSPLFDGNEVYGIIVRGNNDGKGNKNSPDDPLNLCFALSSTAILEVIDKLKL